MTVGNNGAFVALKGVTKRYRDLIALDEVSFQIRRGEIFGYIGPNGAGKTTTIKVLVGLLSAFQGEVYVGDQPMPSARAHVHKMLGYLPQQVAFQEWRTVDHVLSTFGKLSGLRAVDLSRRIEEILALLHLTPMRYKKVGELSGGMVQKLGLAQALLHDPKLLILDEPLAGLDPASRHQVKTVLRQLSREGTTVLFSSHILSDVQDVATRIGILNQGRLVHTGTLDELLHELRLTDEIEVLLSRNSGCWQELTSLAGVLAVKEPSPHQLTVHLDPDADRDEIIHRLIVGLLHQGCRIRSLQPLSRSLDQVYLGYLEKGTSK